MVEVQSTKVEINDMVVRFALAGLDARFTATVAHEAVPSLKALYSSFASRPNNKQAAIAQCALAGVKAYNRQLWIVPSGQGKSRIQQWITLLALELKVASIVICVFDRGHFAKRDQVEFASLFATSGRSNAVKYVVGLEGLRIALGEHPKALVIFDEIDVLLFGDSSTFLDLTKTVKSISFTGTPENAVRDGFEATLLELAEFKKISPYGEGDHKRELSYDGEFVIEEMSSLIEEKLATGPVIAYVGNVFDVTLEVSLVVVDEDTEPFLLRSLGEKHEGKYRLFLVTPDFGTRGVDFRSNVPVTLVIGHNFNNQRDLIQCYKRVGRQGDSCFRFKLAGDLIDKSTAAEYDSKILQAIKMLESKKKK